MNVMSRVATAHLPAFSRPGVLSALALLISLLLIGVGIHMPTATG
jgi:hypothetical protein